MIGVGYYSKLGSQRNGPRSKVTEIGYYQFMTFLSDIGGILKITSLLFAAFTWTFNRKWIKKQLRKVHQNIDYIMSYEGLTGLFDDVQRLKRIVFYYLVDMTRVNSSRIEKLEALVEAKDR